jgi:L-amino acid N-acyltransferase YncA
MDIQIRAAGEKDAAAVAGIYNHCVINTHVTFETEPVSGGEMARRMAAGPADRLPWLVAVSRGSVIGYAYAAVWNRRKAYRHTVESTIYMDPGHTGKGFGYRLYRQLMEELRGRPLHAVVAGIALPNEQSIRLHEALGFRKVAHFEQVGYKLDRWIDVGYWELLLQAAGKADNLRRPGVAM